jgi:dynein regulatory complex subunit 2
MKERMSIRIHYDNLKAKMTRQRDDKEKHLGQLSLSALNCIEILNGYKKLGEKILKTAELCRKLETEKEKVLPFYESDPDAGEQEKVEIRVDMIKGLDKDAYGEFQNLDQFYKRFNKVLLDKLAIEKQKATLEKENAFFKDLLKQYLDGVSVNDDVINNANPLLVVNNKLQLNRPPVIRDSAAHTTVVEGNVVVNNTAMQRNANYY